jgi:hypothetical protein
MIFVSFDIGVKNLALCVLRHDDDKITIIDWDVISLAESKKQIKGVNNIAEVLFYELDNIIGKLQTKDINHIDKVMIENQPSNLNGIMKTIQYLIFSYFDLLRHWDGVVGEVHMINPSLKLQHHEYQPDSKKSTEKLSRRDKYKQNKSDGIEICSHYIRNDDILKNIFRLHKKKDDLADTCLQTVAYIRKAGSKINDISLDPSHLLDI